MRIHVKFRKLFSNVFMNVKRKRVLVKYLFANHHLQIHWNTHQLSHNHIYAQLSFNTTKCECVRACEQILNNTNPLKYQLYYAQLNLTPTFHNLPFNIKGSSFSCIKCDVICFFHLPKFCFQQQQSDSAVRSRSKCPRKRRTY